MPENEEKGGWRFLTRSLRHRNYRLFFGGQSISLVGTWLTRTATGWLIFDLTKSVWTLGLLSFVGQLPTLLLVPVAGVLVDRWDLRRLLVVTQVLAMIQSLALAVLALTGAIQVWQIVALSVFQGVINAFDMPGRQCFLIQIVEKKEDLPNAIALNSSMFNGAKILGPAVAGILYDLVGAGLCFLIDGLSYLAVIAALCAMRVKPRPKSPSDGQQMLAGLKEGFSYVFGFLPIRATLGLLALVSLMSMPYMVLMPALVQNTLHGDSRMFGYLMSASGVGALCGALFLATRRSVRGLGKIIVAAGLLSGCAIILLGLSEHFWISLPLMMLIGFGLIVQIASCNTIIQTLTDDDKRGRVMSFYTLALMGMLPIGSLLGGSLADLFGTPNTLIICGSVCLLAALAFLRMLPAIRLSARPVYAEKGIIPELASGIQSASQMNVPPED